MGTKKARTEVRAFFLSIRLRFVSDRLQESGHIRILADSDAGWSSLAARRAHNPKVVGSNPTPATSFLKARTSVRAFSFAGK